MVLLSHEMGKSHAALETFGAVMGIPPMHLKTFQSHDKNVTAAEIAVGEEMLKRSADTIRQTYADVDTNLREALDNGLHPLVDISVIFDGTWMKRGFTSLYGVGVCIDILTGLVIDFHVLSEFCHACSQRKAQKPTDAEWEEWYKHHQPDCCINHTNSSKAMEQAAAEMIWGRSVEKYGLRYVEMLIDGDSSALKAVCDLEPYGEDITISKLECVNHAHKRMGTALRKLAKEERLGGRGVGRLTAAKCDRLQNFYRSAIMDNIPDVRRMISAVWAGLFHSMSTDKEPQHHQCPKGEDSWCFYQQALARREPPPSHSQHPSHTFLTTSVAHKLISVYRRMSDEALLSRMTHGALKTPINVSTPPSGFGAPRQHLWG